MENKPSGIDPRFGVHKEVIGLTPMTQGNPPGENALNAVYPLTFAVSLVMLPALLGLIYVLMICSPLLAHLIGAIVSNNVLHGILQMISQQYFLIGFFVLVVIRLFSQKSPTHLIMRPEGLMAFQGSRCTYDLREEGVKQFFARDNWTIEEYLFTYTHGFLSKVNWKSVEQVSLETSKRHKGAKIICFHLKNKHTVKMRLGDLLSNDLKIQLAQALKDYAPTAVVDEEVNALLESREGNNYTEIWFSALTAAPKRERLAPLAEGMIIGDGRYQVREELGRGGQGSAYIAASTDESKKATVVIKEYVLPISVSTVARTRAMESLKHEVQLLQKINCPQIIKIDDFFIEDQRGYLVLEQAHGKNLREIIRETGPMGENQVHKLCLSMCTILDYMHNQKPPIVHRDFTPDNLILSYDGNLKLVDFNIAQQESGDSNFNVAGKRAYMPPEQFKGQCVTQSDLYALGATLYFLLIGEDPEPLSCLHVRDRDSQLTEQIDNLIARCTELDITKRWQSVGDITNALGQ